MALTPGLSHGQATRKARPLQRMNHNYEYIEMKTTIFFILSTLPMTRGWSIYVLCEHQ